jgi:hypothetical protein
MESRSGIIVLLLVALGGCGSDGGDSLFGDPPEGSQGGKSGGGSGGKAGSAGLGAGRSGASAGGSAGSTAVGGKGGEGTGAEPSSGGSTQEGAGEGGEGENGGTGNGGSTVGGTGNGGSTVGGTGNGGSTSGGSGGEPGGGKAGSNPGGGTAGSGGRGEAECAELASEYLEVLKVAQVCDPDIDLVQCTEEVPSTLACGCPTFVNPKNQKAVARLHALERVWLESCPPILCPAIACELPEQGFCTSSGSGSGHCTFAGAAE